MSESEGHWWALPPEPDYIPDAAPAGDSPGAPSRRRVKAAAGALALTLVGAAAGAGVAHAYWPKVAGRASGSGGTSSGSGGSAVLPSQGGSGQLPWGFGREGDGSGSDGSDGSDGGDGSGGVDGSGSAGSSTGNGPADAAAIARNVNPGVVDINVTLGYQSAEAAGTGMVLSSDGEILTNNHVIDGATRISVTDVGNGRTYQANVVGYDRSDDVALLQLVGASGLRTVTLGSSSTIRVGQAVVAVGNAGGQGGTPSYAGGTVTALNQTITATSDGTGSSEQLTGLVQTDADVVAGDSGGPLVDAAGKVVGMDTAASAGMRFSGAEGYAIPIDRALTIAHEIEGGHASGSVHVGATAMLGVTVAGSDQGYGGSGSGSTSGVQIQQVMSGGAAAAAGLESGDIITALDGHRVTSSDALSALMTTEQPGKRVSISYVDRSGQQHTAGVTLGTGPAQ